VSEAVVGIIFASFSLSEFGISLVLGRFLHKVGMKKKAIVFGLIMALFGTVLYLLLPLTQNKIEFIITSLIGRIVSGIVILLFFHALFCNLAIGLIVIVHAYIQSFFF